MIRFASMPRSIASRVRRGKALDGDAQALRRVAGLRRRIASNGGEMERARSSRRRRAGTDLARESACGCWSPPSATPGMRSRRSRWRGRWPGAGTRWWSRRGSAGASRSRSAGLGVHGGRGVHDLPSPAAGLDEGASAGRRGAGAGAAARARSAPTSSSATSSRWRRRWPPSAPGCARATLIPHVYPVHEPGMPFFAVRVRCRRGRRSGGRLWRAALPVLVGGLRRGREEMNESRAAVGLAPLERFHGGISEELALVATFPQLEYPRRWPAHVQVTGPIGFELPHPDVELPAGRRAAGAGGAVARRRTPSAGWCGWRSRRWRTSRCGCWRRRTGTGPRRRCRRRRRTRWSSTGSATRRRCAAADLVDLPRRPRDGGAGARRRACRCSAARRSATWPRTARGWRGRAPG